VAKRSVARKSKSRSKSTIRKRIRSKRKIRSRIDSPTFRSYS